jgi:hypothetical protein
MAYGLPPITFPYFYAPKMHSTSLQAISNLHQSASKSGEYQSKSNNLYKENGKHEDGAKTQEDIEKSQEDHDCEMVSQDEENVEID